MSVNIQLICLGLQIASKAVNFHKNTQFQENLSSLITSSTESIKKAIEMSSEKVIYKIEQDKMEELISRLNNINMLIKMENKDQLLNYVLRVQESVDYAKNRLDEGKKQWFMPYLTGKAIIFAAFTYLDNISIEMEEEFFSVLECAKQKMLDEIAVVLVKSERKIPWEVIRDILNNKENALNKIVSILPTENGTCKNEVICVANDFLDQLHKICKKYEILDPCYVDNIPNNKLQNAMLHFKIPDNEKIILLYDSTVFGSCKIGFAICSNAIYWAVDWRTQTKKTVLIWKEFSTLDFRKESIATIYTEQEIRIFVLNNEEKIICMLNEIKALIRGEFISE